MSDPTDLTGYDIVLAVTQEGLNTALSYSQIWTLPIDYNLSANPPPPNPPPATPPPQSASVGLFGASMSAPTLSLTLPDGHKNSSDVALTLSFTSGTLQTVNIYTFQIASTDISGWSIQATVQLSLAPVTGAPTSSMPPAVLNALSDVNLSVNQLFFDLVEVNWNTAHYYSSSGAELTDTSLTSVLLQALQAYYRSLADDQKQIVLGWAQSAHPGYTPPNAIAAFVPTAYTFSVSPWNTGYASAPYNTAEYDGLGTVNFLMMTQGRPLPDINTNKDAGEFETNWVPAPNTEQYQGTLAMTSALFTSGFVDGILLPEIAELIGANDSRFGGVAPSITCPAHNQWSITQSFTLYGSENDGKGQLVSDDFLVNVYQKIWQQVHCTVTFNPSTLTYSVQGSYDAKLYMTSVAIGFLPITYDVPYSQPWSFTITLKAGADGAISTTASKVTLGTPPSSNGKAEGDDFLGSLDAPLANLVGDITDTYGTNFESAASDIANAATSSLGQDLAPAMTSLSTSVIFPGAYNYAYKNLAFSTGGEQNLLSNVTIIS